MQRFLFFGRCLVSKRNVSYFWWVQKELFQQVWGFLKRRAFGTAIGNMVFSPKGFKEVFFSVSWPAMGLGAEERSEDERAMICLSRNMSVSGELCQILLDPERPAALLLFFFAFSSTSLS